MYLMLPNCTTYFFKNHIHLKMAKLVNFISCILRKKKVYKVSFK